MISFLPNFQNSALLFSKWKTFLLFSFSFFVLQFQKLQIKALQECNVKKKRKYLNLSNQDFGKEKIQVESFIFSHFDWISLVLFVRTLSLSVSFSFFFGHVLMLKKVGPVFFYLPDPSTVVNTSFKCCRRVTLGETINITSN